VGDRKVRAKFQCTLERNDGRAVIAFTSGGP